MDVIKANEWIIITDQASSFCRLDFVDESKDFLLFNRRFEIPTKFLIGLPYGSAITQNGEGEWVRCSRISIDSLVERVLQRLRELGITSGDSDMAEADENIEPTEDVENIKTGARGTQKLSADEVILRKSAKQPLFDLIVDLCAGAESFKDRSIYSQEKYIRRKLGRHLLLITIQRVTLSSVHQAYIGLGSGIRNDNGNTVGGRTCSCIPLEVLGTMLNESNVQPGHSIIVFDQTMGMLAGAAMTRLVNENNDLGSQLIFASESRGSSSHIMKKMNFDPATLKLIYREIQHNILQAATQRPAVFNDESLKEEFPLFFCGARIERKPDLSEFHQKRLEEAIERRDFRLGLRLHSWSKLAAQQVDSVLSSTNSSSFTDNDIRAVANHIGDIYNIALHTLRPNGRLVMYHNDMQPLSDLYAFIKARRHTWCDCSFIELCHRRICTLPGRSHPQMDTSIRLSQGFVLMATRMVEIEADPTDLGNFGAENNTTSTIVKPDNNPLAERPSSTVVS